jgi:chitin disaccharide deacetylase
MFSLAANSRKTGGVTGFPIILCADDYALAPGVTIGILEALAAGRLNATSAMTNRPVWASAARDLDRFAPGAAVGLHFNLTLGAPLSKMPVFAPYDRFPPLERVLRGARRGALPEAEIRGELAAQLDAFEDALGRPPDYLDGHQHVQALSGVREAVFEELSARGLAGRLWLRDSADRPGRIVRRGGEIVKALALAYLGRGFRAAAARRGFVCNDGFAGFSAFDPHADYGAEFARYLVAPGARHLVMCHPGRVDQDLIACDPATTSRENELAFLLSDAFAQRLADAGARLGRWDKQD